MPAHAQYAVAWFQSTQFTGWFTRSGFSWLQYGDHLVRSVSLMSGQSTVACAGMHFPAFTHAAYAPIVTSVSSIRNGCTVTIFFVSPMV
ncbi:MAG: hypothetical protein WCS72_13035 [Deltaproteobacteria bacterium]